MIESIAFLPDNQRSRRRAAQVGVWSRYLSLSWFGNLNEIARSDQVNINIGMERLTSA